MPAGQLFETALQATGPWSRSVTVQLAADQPSASMLRSRRRGQVIAPRPVFAIAAAGFAKPPLPVVIDPVRRAAAQRQRSLVIAPRPHSTLPAAFDKPPQPVVVDPVRLVARQRRSAHVIAPRPVFPVGAVAFARPPLPVVIRAAGRTAQRRGGDICQRRFIPETPCPRRPVVIQARPQRRRGGSVYQRGVITTGAAPPPEIIVTGSFNTSARGQVDDTATQPGYVVTTTGNPDNNPHEDRFTS